MNQTRADRLYDLKAKELDERAMALQKAEEECQRAVRHAADDYNNALVSCGCVVVLLPQHLFQLCGIDAGCPQTARLCVLSRYSSYRLTVPSSSSQYPHCPSTFASVFLSFSSPPHPSSSLFSPHIIQPFSWHVFSYILTSKIPVRWPGQCYGFTLSLIFKYCGGIWLY